MITLRDIANHPEISQNAVSRVFNGKSDVWAFDLKGKMQISGPTPRKSALRGFTLIELLVVVAVIALLAAILFPVFGRARDNARRSSCASNIKQLSLAFMQYTQDYDERVIPISVTGTVSGVAGENAFCWPVLLFPYTKSTQVLTCPSNVNNPVDPQIGVPTRRNTLNFTYNFYMQSGKSPKNLAQIQLPSQTPLFMEALGAPYANQSSTVGQALCFLATNSTTGVAGIEGRALKDPTNLALGWTGRDLTAQAETYIMGQFWGAGAGAIHFNGSNMAYADGHVKWIKSRGKVSGPNGAVYDLLECADLDYNIDGKVGCSTTAPTGSQYANFGFDY